MPRLSLSIGSIIVYFVQKVSINLTKSPKVTVLKTFGRPIFVGRMLVRTLIEYAYAHRTASGLDVMLGAKKDLWTQ